MNKKIILSALAFASVLTACDDDYMKQFEDQDANITDVKNLTMTLENSDYSSIASNATNIAKALELDPENQTYVEMLKQVGTQYYFTDDIAGEDYIPAYLMAKYPNADQKSKFTVTYKKFKKTSSYLADFANISSYQLSGSDYEGVWGDKVKASFLTPQTLNRIPGILKENMSGAAEGTMCVVNYAYSDVEPSIGGGTVEEVSPYTKISEVIANGAGVESTIKAEVVGTYAKGILVSDGSGSILVYPNKVPNYSVGDSVIVTGTTSSYGGLLQYPNTSTITRSGKSESYKYPKAEEMDAATLNSWMKSPVVKYAKVTGKLSITTNSKGTTYYNVEIEGVNGQGSISYPMTGIVDPALNGKDVDINGYLIGVTGSSTKYANIMMTSICEKGGTMLTPIGVLAASEAGEHKAEGVVIAKYARGFLISDGTGKMLVYKSKGYDVEEGDVVAVDGKTSLYSGLMQFNSPKVTKLERTAKVSQPVAQELTAADFTSYVTAPYYAYVTYTGKLSITTNDKGATYYNIAIDGTSAQGSISFPLTGVVSPDLNGKTVTVTGYAFGQSSGKYLNTMITTIAEATPAKAKIAFRAGANVQPNASVLYRLEGTEWKAYTNDDVKVAVLSPKDYEELGSATVGDPANALPIYLAKKFPYLVDESMAVVVYAKSNDAMAAKEFSVSNGVWAPATNYTMETAVFVKDGDEISANISTHFDNSLINDEGGLKAQDTELTGDLTYIWKNNNYGWVASAYKNGTTLKSESWLVTPAFNFLKAKHPVMTFDHACNKMAGYSSDEELKQLMKERMKVFVSVNYTGDVKTCDWTELEIPGWPTGTDWNFAPSGIIDLSSVIGNKKVVIAFMYKSTEISAQSWEVQNLKVYEQTEE
ncbi:MAG: choice-of-anchor J domain-containing protein [Prevotella sp.]|nr:choice-of-anchor J domain-containing protein [Prevotella sp.]